MEDVSGHAGDLQEKGQRHFSFLFCVSGLRVTVGEDRTGVGSEFMFQDLGLRV